MFRPSLSSLFRSRLRARSAPAPRSRFTPRLDGLEDRLTPVAVTYQTVSTWNSGFQASLTVTNDTSTPLTNWSLSFDFGATITEMWNGSVTASTNGQYAVANAGYNSTIAPNQSVAIGFLGTGSPSPAPTDYAVNGAPVGTSPPSPPAAPLPGASVADVTVSRGVSNTTAVFTVSLSAASTTPVTATYATADGTGRAGTDYNAATGTVTFPAGTTTQTITVGIPGSAQPAPDRTFTLTLSQPSGATLTRATATATVHTTTVAQPLPQLSASSATGTEGTPGAQTAGGFTFLHTDGNQIVDAYGNDVKIAGVNWSGLETNDAPGGLEVRSYQSEMDQMKQLGFNTIRLPINHDTLLSSSYPNNVNYSLNPDLQGVNGLGVMDKIVAYADQIGLRIIFDYHGNNASGLWYSDAVPESAWISDWTMLAARYAGNPTVLGADLYNEPHGPVTWGDGNVATDWRLAAERAGNAILAVNPNWLIFVEGIDNGTTGWWGGNLSLAGQYPVQLSAPGHLVYSAHDYGTDVYPQNYFSAPDYPNNLVGLWNENFGYLYLDNIAPVWIGEFGSKLQTTVNREWYSYLTSYLAGDMNPDGSNAVKPGQQGISWTYWEWNPDSADTGGILASDWQTPLAPQMNGLKPIEFAFPTGGTSGGTAGTPLSFVVSLSAASATPVTVAYATANGTAVAGVDYTATSGTLTFAPGQTSQTVTVPVLDADLTTADLMSLLLSSPSGATIGQGTGTGTIQPASSSGVTSTPSSDVTASFAVTQSWGNAFNANITLTNDGTTPISNWTLNFDVPYALTAIWSVNVVSQSGNDFTVQPLSYDDVIPPGGSITFGFTAAASPSAGGPTNYKLNGQPL